MTSSPSAARGRRPRLVLVAVAALATTTATNVAAQTGSGTVAFAFTSFSGPISLSTFADRNDPTAWGTRGLVNEVAVAPSGTWVDGGYINSPDFGHVLGSTALAPSNTVALRYDYVTAGTLQENVISFVPRPFTNVSVGQNFVLGTLTFQNGFWYGGGGTPAFNVTSDLGFTITTSSASGAAFNQTITGVVRMVVNAPDEADPTTSAGQMAQADWVYIDSPAAIGTLGAFRVYDDCCKPAGAGTIGTVDVIARFNSLDLVGLANPSGGFITGSVAALPTSAVPEPTTWALVGSGLCVLVARLRRRGSSRTARSAR